MSNRHGLMKSNAAGEFFSSDLQLRREREQRNAPDGEDSGEFDELVLALRSGEVFDKDLSKMHRRKQRRHNTFDDSRERAAPRP